MTINIDKLSKRLQLLLDGKVLLFKHALYGSYIVQMNPQKNRIFHEGLDLSSKHRASLMVKSDTDKTMHYDNDAVTEEKIHKMLMWDCGEWFLYEEPKKPECPHCYGKGYVSEEVELEEV